MTQIQPDPALPDACHPARQTEDPHRKGLADAISGILSTLDDKDCFAHVGDDPIHFSTSVSQMIDTFRQVLFPGYFSHEKIDETNLVYSMGREISRIYDILSRQVTHVMRHDCLRYGQACQACEEKGHETALAVIQGIPELRRLLARDVRGAYDGDPAARSHDEIIYSYPGIYAIMVYRIAHILHRHGIPQLPRIMSEHAHSLTGIDIHPGARIGPRFVIDHGTGIVVGETAVIGSNVRVYQNVTIGALSLPPDAGKTLKDAKRHPTIEDDVIIYSGATILGGETVIGRGAVVGGNVWLTESVPPETKVFIKSPELIYKHNNRKV